MSTLHCYLRMTVCIFRTKKHLFHTFQARVVHKENKSYYWTRAHLFGINCLKASSDKVKLHYLKYENGLCHLEWPFQSEFLLSSAGEFQHKTYSQSSTGPIMLV